MSEDKTAHSEENRIASVIKNRWKNLQKKQTTAGNIPDSERIATVSVQKNAQKHPDVRVKTADGKDLSAGDGRKLFKHLSERMEMRNESSRIAAFVDKIREEGFSAVEGEIPPFLRDAVIEACRRENISLTSKGERAEREEKAQKEAEHREKEKEQRDRNDAAKKQGQNKGFVAGKSLFGAPIVLNAPVASGLWSMPVSLPQTQAVAEAQKRGVRFDLPAVLKDFPPDLRDMIRKETELSLLIGAEAIGKIPDKVVSLKPTRIGSKAKTATLDINGRKVVVTAPKAEDLPMNVVQIKGMYALLDMYDKGPSSLSKSQMAVVESLLKNAKTRDVEKAKDILNSGTILGKTKHLKKDDIPEPLREDYKNAITSREVISASVEKNKKVLNIGDSENGQTVHSSRQERNEKEKDYLDNNPIDLRSVARNQGMTLKMLGEVEQSLRGKNPLKKENKNYKALLELGAFVFNIDRDKPISQELLLWAERHEKDSKKFQDLRRQYNNDPDEILKHLPPLEISPATLEKRLMPEKLAAAARPEVLSPVNTDAGHVAAQLRKNAEKLALPVQKKSLQETLGRKEAVPTKQEPAKKQMPQRTPADIARIKKIQDLQQARR